MELSYAERERWLELFDSYMRLRDIAKIDDTKYTRVMKPCMHVNLSNIPFDLLFPINT